MAASIGLEHTVERLAPTVVELWYQLDYTQSLQTKWSRYHSDDIRIKCKFDILQLDLQISYPDKSIGITFINVRFDEIQFQIKN